MKNLIENTCVKCGSVAEPKLTFAGPHIKMICSDCYSYIKFINTTLIPDVRTIKQRIFSITNGDIEKIQNVKKDLAIFYDGISGIDAKIAYWSLYLEILKTQQS